MTHQKSSLIPWSGAWITWCKLIRVKSRVCRSHFKHLSYQKLPRWISTLFFFFQERKCGKSKSTGECRWKVWRCQAMQREERRSLSWSAHLDSWRNSTSSGTVILSQTQWVCYHYHFSKQKIWFNMYPQSLNSTFILQKAGGIWLLNYINEWAVCIMHKGFPWRNFESLPQDWVLGLYNSSACHLTGMQMHLHEISDKGFLTKVQFCFILKFFFILWYHMFLCF